MGALGTQQRGKSPKCLGRAERASAWLLPGDLFEIELFGHSKQASVLLLVPGSEVQRLGKRDGERDKAEPG